MGCIIIRAGIAMWLGLAFLAHAQENKIPDLDAEAGAFKNEGTSTAGQSSAGLADQLANPIASLISVPLQANYDCCYGPEKAGRHTLNIQPVFPFSLSRDWNLITRTIVPVIHQGEAVAGQGSDTGLGDVVQTFFFSPTQSRKGLTWGAGPVLLWPTGDSHFSARKTGIGPSIVVLNQDRGLTYGLLANHIWSVAGDSKRPDVSATFLQPFFAKTFPDSTGVTLQTESTYDWRNKQWTIPISLMVSHIFKFGEQPVSLALGGRYYVERPAQSPHWGLRFVVTFLFPK